MYKKLIALLLCCLTLAAFGCAGDGGEPALPDGAVDLPEDTQAAEEKTYCIDYKDYMFDISTLAPTYAETDEAIYVLKNNIVWFTDKEYKDWMPLCAKPDCTHKSAKCNAFINSDCMVLYGNYLYYVTGSGQHEYDENKNYKVNLCRMKLDGSAHENICDLRAELAPELDFVPDYALWEVQATNKYLVIRLAYNEHSSSDEVVGHSYLYALDLETLQAIPLFSEYSEDPEFTGFCIYEGIGSRVYGSVSNRMEDINAVKTNVLAEVDLATGEIRELGVLTGEIMYYEKSVGIVDGKLYLLTRDIPDFDAADSVGYTEEHLQHLYALDLETLELELVAEEPAIYAKWSVLDTGSGYWYGVVANPLAPEEIRGFYVCDLERNELAFLPASEYPEETGGRLRIDRITDDYIFSGENFSRSVWYLDKAEIGTPDLCWRKWEP